MDLTTSPRCFQAPTFISSSLEPSPLESNTKSLYGKSNSNPFEADTFPDPLCNLNLKEKKLLEAPPTPGRPVFSFTSSNVGSLNRKSFPSKWDDAEKWLISSSSSCHDSPAHNNNITKVGSVKQCESFKQQVEVSKGVSMFQRSASLNNHNSFYGKAFKGGLGSMDVLPKDKYVDDNEPIPPNFKYLEPTKEGFLFKNPACDTMNDAGAGENCQTEHRDVGTEMTPLGSSTTTRCHTPFKYPSPARHNTPENRSGPLAVGHLSGTNSTIDMTQLTECHLAKLQLGTQYDSVASAWNSREEEDMEISKSLRHFNTGNVYGEGISEPRSAAWEDEKNNNCCLRYQREEAKIQAWINLESAKAEAQSRKLEVKIQKMRSNLEEKLMKKMTVVHRKAEELRAEVKQQHSEQINKATSQAQKMISRHNPYFSGHISCGCFPCSNHNRS